MTGAASGTGGGADPMAFPHDWHRDVIADFAAAVRAGRPPAVPGRAALAVHRLIDALPAPPAKAAPSPSDRGLLAATACSTGSSIATRRSAHRSAAPLTGPSTPSGVVQPASAMVPSRFQELASLSAASGTAASGASTKRATQIVAASSARPASRAFAVCSSALPPVTQPLQ